MASGGEFEFLRAFVSIQVKGLEETARRIDTRLSPLIAKLSRPIALNIGGAGAGGGGALGALSKLNIAVGQVATSFLKAGPAIVGGFFNKILRGYKSLVAFQRRLRFELLLAVNILGEEFRELALAVSPALLLGDTVNKILIFDDAITRTASTLKIFRREAPAAFKAVADGIRAITVGSRFTADEVADAAFSFAQAGFDTQATLGATTKAIELAQAGFVTLTEASEIAAAALKQFGIPTNSLEETKQALDDINDILVEAQLEGLATVQSLGETFKKGGPISQAVGVSVEEFATVTVELSKIGVVGEEAGTAIRRAFQRIATQPKDFRDAIEKLGIDLKALQDSSGKFKPGGFIQFFKELQRSGATLEDLTDIFGAKAGQLVRVVQFADELDSINDKLERAKKENVAAKISAANADSLKGVVQQARSAFTTLQSSLGDIFGEGIRGAASGIADFSKRLQEAFGSSRVRELINTLASALKETAEKILPAINSGLKIMVLAAAGVVGSFRKLIEFIEDLLVNTLGLRTAFVELTGFSDTWANTLQAAILLLSDGDASARSLLKTLETVAETTGIIGSSLLKSLTEIAVPLADTIGRLLERAVLTGLKEVLSTVKDTALGAFLDAKTAISNIDSRINPTETSAAKLAEALRRARSIVLAKNRHSIVDFLFPPTLDQGEVKAEFKRQLEKIGITGSGLTPLQESFDKLSKTAAESFKKNFQAADILSPFRELLRFIQAELAPALDGLLQKSALKDNIQGTLQGARALGDSAISAFERLSKIRVPDIREGLLNIFNTRGGASGIGRALEGIGRHLPDAFKDGFTKIKDTFTNIGAISATTGEKLETAFGSVVDRVSSLFFGTKRPEFPASETSEVQRKIETLDTVSLVRRLNEAGSQKIEEKLLEEAKRGAKAGEDALGRLDTINKTLIDRTFPTVLA